MRGDGNCAAILSGAAVQHADSKCWSPGVNEIVPVEQPATVPQPVIASGITVILLVGFFLWSREQRLRSQRRRLRRTYKLGEEILGASSAATILKRISEALPSIIGVTRVRIVRVQPDGEDAGCDRRRKRRSHLDLAFLSAGRNSGGSGGVLPLPHPAGDPGYRPQPVSRSPDRTGSAARRACCSSR